MLLSSFKYICFYSGRCTEFNVAGGRIHIHHEPPCNNEFPKCDKVYNSTDAYKCKSLPTAFFQGILIDACRLNQCGIGLGYTQAHGCYKFDKMYHLHSIQLKRKIQLNQ